MRQSVAHQLDGGRGNVTLSTADALQELRRSSGTQFDPVVVRALCAELDGTAALSAVAAASGANVNGLH